MTLPPSPDIRDHFSLRAIPFTRELEVEKRWRHPPVEETLSEFIALVDQRQSGALIAPAGAGKTLLARTLRELLPPARYRVQDLKVTDLSKRDFCRELAVVVGAKPAGNTGALVRAIQGRCDALVREESLRPVLLIDEAQDFRTDVLGLLRVLTHFDMDSRLVISIILIGQPSLRALLSREELLPVTRRLALFAELRLLTRDELRDYVKHRLRIVGGADGLFDHYAHDALFELTQGNLRAADHLALKSMEEAAKGGAAAIGAEHVSAARRKVML